MLDLSLICFILIRVLETVISRSTGKELYKDESDMMRLK